MSDYIHRCGRTGRLGSEKNGIVTNLVSSKSEVDLVQKIEVNFYVFHVIILKIEFSNKKY